MSRLRIRRAVNLRLEIIAPEVGLLILFLFLVGLAEPPALVWFLFVGTMVLIQTILFYRLGRISEQMALED